MAPFAGLGGVALLVKVAALVGTLALMTAAEVLALVAPFGV